MRLITPHHVRAWGVFGPTGGISHPGPVRVLRAAPATLHGAAGGLVSQGPE